ncbi:MAG TPA: hypothetical protein VE397_21880 [Stellaceae bacterium]|jgi:hypothetical protein|nr:hypothetical protein [Stellaceae bacterium]
MVRALFPLLLCCIAAGSAAEANQTVLSSTAPYWQVGVRDDALSRACSLNEFGPLHPGDLTARFSGAQGDGLLDVAKGTGLNLRDPNHLAKPTEDYFFRNVGTTSCEVLVGGRKGAKSAGP